MSRTPTILGISRVRFLSQAQVSPRGFLGGEVRVGTLRVKPVAVGLFGIALDRPGEDDLILLAAPVVLVVAQLQPLVMHELLGVCDLLPSY